MYRVKSKYYNVTMIGLKVIFYLNTPIIRISGDEEKNSFTISMKPYEVLLFEKEGGKTLFLLHVLCRFHYSLFHHKTNPKNINRFSNREYLTYIMTPKYVEVRV